MNETIYSIIYQHETDRCNNTTWRELDSVLGARTASVVPPIIPYFTVRGMVYVVPAIHLPCISLR